MNGGRIDRQNFDHSPILRQRYYSRHFSIEIYTRLCVHGAGRSDHAGSTYNTCPIEILDHDFPSLATGVAIPHGLYDVAENIGFIQIGTSHDTSEFACDSIRYWWDNYGKNRYPLASSILILCDGGGSKHYWHLNPKSKMVDRNAICRFVVGESGYV